MPLIHEKSYYFELIQAESGVVDQLNIKTTLIKGVYPNHPFRIGFIDNKTSQGFLCFDLSELPDNFEIAEVALAIGIKHPENLDENYLNKYLKIQVIPFIGFFDNLTITDFNYKSPPPALSISKNKLTVDPVIGLYHFPVDSYSIFKTNNKILIRFEFLENPLNTAIELFGYWSSENRYTPRLFITLQ